MKPRPAATARLLTAALSGTLAIAVTACSAGGNSASSSPAGAASPAFVSTAKVLTLTAARAKRVTSFSATIDSSSSGTYSTHVHGTLTEQTRPALLADEKFTVTAAGIAVPGGMEALVTGNSIYLKMSSLSRMLGKPWARLSFSSLQSGTGVSLGPLVRQLQASSPLNFAQMLPAARHVRKAGTATINGVPATEYTGTLDPLRALARLDPGLRKLVRPAYAAAGSTSGRFTVWLDSQYQLRKLILVQAGPQHRSTTSMVVTSVNQPVHVQVPPAGQTAAMPGL